MPGKSTYSGVFPIMVSETFSMYYDDNYCIDGPYNNCPTAASGTWEGTHVYDNESGTVTKLQNPVVTVSGYSPISVVSDNGAALKTEIINYAGAWPSARDSVDIRAVYDVKNGTHKYNQINSQDEVGGWPNLAENTWNVGTLDGNGNPGPIPSNPHGDDDSDGYTNLEEWLHAFAAHVEERDQKYGAVSAPQGLIIRSKL
jgi:hypothetical protein